MTEGSEVAQIREVLYICRCLHGVDLFDLVRNEYDPNSFFEGRPYQAALFVIIAHFVEALLDTRVEEVGFYSAGAGPAFIFSGVFSLATYLEDVVPFQQQIRRAMLDVGERLPLFETILQSSVDDDLQGYVASVLVDHKLSDRLFIKDKLGRHCVHLAGYESDLSSLRDQIWRRFPGARSSGLRLHKTLGSHLLLHDRKPIDTLLDKVTFSPPIRSLVDISGARIACACPDQWRLAQVFADAHQNFMDTGAAVGALTQSGRRVVVVGTPFGAKNVRRIEAENPSFLSMASEIIGRSRFDNHSVASNSNGAASGVGTA